MPAAGEAIRRWILDPAPKLPGLRIDAELRGGGIIRFPEMRLSFRLPFRGQIFEQNGMIPLEGWRAGEFNSRQGELRHRLEEMHARLIIAIREAASRQNEVIRDFMMDWDSIASDAPPWTNY